MGKRALLNLWLVVALGVLVWVVWQEPGHAPKPTPVKLTGLNPKSISDIVITSDKGTIRLAKRGGQWRLLEPVEVVANPVIVDSVLQVADADSQSRFPAAGRDLKPFGLDHPEVSLRLNDTELRIGGVTPLDQQRYVQVGDTIHLINGSYFFGLNADPSAFVSRDLIPKDQALQAIQLPDVKLVQKNGQWTAKPAQGALTSDVFAKVAQAWHEAQALRITHYDKRPSKGTVVIEFDKGRPPLRYEILARQPQLILARPDIGMQYYLAGDEVSHLLTLEAPSAKPSPNKK